MIEDTERMQSWYENTSDEDKYKLFLEHHALKQGLCAQRLGILTGSDDWLEKSIKRARELTECEVQLNSLLREMETKVVDIKRRINSGECFNCNGEGVNIDHSIGEKNTCCICKGTGMRVA